MADNEDKSQKTEEATPRRVQEAREKGQVAMSSEFSAAMALATAIGAFLFGGRALFEALGGLIVDTGRSLSTLGTTNLSPVQCADVLTASIQRAALPLAMVTLPAVVLSAVVGYGQIGLKFAPKAIEIDPSKLDPVKGMGKLLGLRSVVRTSMALAKVVLIATTVIIIARMHVDEVVRVGINELRPLLIGVMHIVLRCAIGAITVILLLSLIDLMYQRWQHKKDLRMTKQEVKEEHRLTEGDPHIRARIRQVQREMATRRMMADVPDATVVVTNPTHYAVAMRYDHGPDGQPLQAAPVVVAKGVDHVAQRIKEIASEAGVVLYEDVPLARSLHARCEIGKEIPEDLYTAVAAVLGYVMRLEKGAVGA